jgi:hypothetical protein
MPRTLTLAAALTALALMPTALATAKPAGPAPGNAAAAKSCQKDGFQNVRRSDGSSFKNAGACTSYTARGGVLQSPQTAQTPQAACEAVGGEYAEQIADFQYLCSGAPSLPAGDYATLLAVFDRACQEAYGYPSNLAGNEDGFVVACGP